MTFRARFQARVFRAPRLIAGALGASLLFSLCTAGAPADPVTVTSQPLLAQAPSASQATLTGSVKTPAGAPVSGAKIALSGPTSVAVTTDATGTFTIVVEPGIYQILVTRTGYSSAALHDLTIVAGESQPLTITMSQQDLSTLRVIGTVSTSRGASSINTGAASQTFIPAQAFTDLANPQINDVLQRSPDITVQHMGSQADTTLIVGGAQPYETQVLIDGHPLALGQYGVWSSQYFPSFLVGGAEIQSGPGNTTPFANIAVGGTLNLTTPGFTRKPTAEFTTGFDNYASQNSEFLTTGSIDKFGYVIGIGTASTNGPFFGKSGCVVSPANPANDNTPQSSGIIQFCGALSGPLFTNGDLLKLKYDFSPVTSFEADFTGAWSGFDPQGSAWGNSIGETKITNCLGSASDPTAICGDPAYASLAGSTINAYVIYPGSSVYNNQTLFDGQFRTALGSDTLLVRPYVGDIEPEAIDGSEEGAYPAFYSSPANVPSCPSGTPIASCGGVASGTGSTFESSICPVGNVFSYSQINSPSNTVVTKNGQEECFQYPYSAFEQDKLYGTTFSYLHPFGDNLLNLTYDFHGQSTFAYFNAPSNVSVPTSTNRYSTFSLTGFLHPIQNVGLNIGLYDTHWTVAGVQPQLDANGNPVLDQYGVPVLTGLGRGISRFDPHAALTYRPKGSVSYRASFGTSATFPFVGQVSGNASYQPFASSAPQYTAGVLIEKNPSLDPEVSAAYGVGVDNRFRNGSVLSVDVLDTVIHNVFETDVFGVTTSSGFEGITAPINVARLRSLMATLKYTYAPALGFGFNASVAAERSIVDGIPDSAYQAGVAGFPVNNVQICGNGLVTPGIPTCIPYLKGYGQLTYTWKDGTYAEVGADYEGKNNSYFQPPFAVVDATVRRPVTPNVEFLFAVQNLLNTNFFNGLPEPNAGVPLVAGSLDANGHQIQTSYASTLIPATARTIHVDLRLHTGR